ncbi:MAG: MarR family transcriptional regulator [Cyclobacteriaceae bacterium]|nr:MarR family transcriptional regulator [Cyclobacteriaceae bacterium]MCK5209604.1 MarR family transcriptional regulator [Cyclobacteriaceae bacterium]MCK5278225.1 MarR family transcriptional regulator [Cyclobacteriaceae bacterium]MCK5371357.1 MarR family transcriptional regulator [Cyclobacteriaceae bacterium]
MKKEESIDYYIKSSWHSLSRLYNQKAQKHGITTSIAFILLNISTSEGTPATKIAPQMGLESRSLTRALKNLEEKGFIYKEKDVFDKRSVRIFLTEKGKEKKGKSIETVKIFNQFVKERVPEEKLNTFIQVSRLIIDWTEGNEELKLLINKD